MNSYGSVDEVSGLVPSAGSITSDSSPNIKIVQGWLNEGFDQINACIKSEGFSVPVTTAQKELFGTVKALNNLYAQIKLLRAKSLDAIIGTEENKAEDLEKIWERDIAKLQNMDLLSLGLSALNASTTRKIVKIRSRKMVRS